MSNWPPDPNKTPDNNSNPNLDKKNINTLSRGLPANSSGREWHLLEKTLMASIEEQRRARRWKIISKLLSLAVILIIFFTMAKGCTASEKELTGFDTGKEHIAVVDIEGVISPANLANADDISFALTQAFKNSKAKAVVLNINSPGGSPVQSDDIWQTMMDLREEFPDKKLYAIIGDIGASGAYYIASAADEIYVNRSSLVGSIGVIMPSYNVEGLMDKVGIKDSTLTAGEYKDILSMSRPLTDFEKDHVESVLANTHKHFIDAVKKGRGNRLKNTEENNIFSGLFWTGEQSIKLGLADKTGNIRTLEKELEIDNVVNYTPIDPFQEIFGNFAIKLGTGIGSSINLDLLPLEKNTGGMQ